MYIFNQDGDALVNSKLVKMFWIDDDSNLLADEETIAQYNNREDAVKELIRIYDSLAVKATSYSLK